MTSDERLERLAKANPTIRDLLSTLRESDENVRRFHALELQLQAQDFENKQLRTDLAQLGQRFEETVEQLRRELRELASHDATPAGFPSPLYPREPAKPAGIVITWPIAGTIVLIGATTIGGLLWLMRAVIALQGVKP